MNGFFETLSRPMDRVDRSMAEFGMQWNKVQGEILQVIENVGASAYIGLTNLSEGFGGGWAEKISYNLLKLQRKGRYPDWMPTQTPQIPRNLIYILEAFTGLSVLLTACGAQPPEAPPTAAPLAQPPVGEAQPAAPKNEDSEAKPNLMQTLTVPENVVPATATPPESNTEGLPAIGFVHRLFEEKKVANDIRGIWSSPEGQFTEVTFLDNVGVEHTVPITGFKYLTDINTFQIQDGTNLWVWENGEYIKVDSANSSVFMAKDLSGTEQIMWNAETQKLEHVIPIPHEALDSMYGPGHYRYDKATGALQVQIPDYNGSYNSNSEWADAVTINPDGTLQIGITELNQFFTIERSKLAATPVNGIVDKYIMTADIPGHGSLGKLLYMPEKGEFYETADLSLHFGGIANYPTSNLDALASHWLERTVLLQPDLFSPDAPKTDLYKGMRWSWQQGMTLSIYPAGLDANSDASNWVGGAFKPITLLNYDYAGDGSTSNQMIMVPIAINTKSGIFVGFPGFSDEYVTNPELGTDGKTLLESNLFTEKYGRQALDLILATYDGSLANIEKAQAWHSEPTLASVVSAEGTSSGSDWYAINGIGDAADKAALQSYLASLHQGDGDPTLLAAMNTPLSEEQMKAIQEKFGSSLGFATFSFAAQLDPTMMP